MRFKLGCQMTGLRASYYFFLFRGKRTQVYHVPSCTQAKSPLGNGLKQAVKIFQKEAKSFNFYSYYFF
jgi:hypothetical protein